MHWREQRSRAIQERILEAARRLVRDRGDTGFSMRTLAARAGVSLATPYNHFGSKAGVLAALLDRMIDRIEDRGAAADSTDPIDQVLRVAETATELICEDPAFYRAIVKETTSIEFALRPQVIRRSLRLWRTSLSHAIEDGVLVPGMQPELLARQLFVQALGVTELWINEELDAESFPLQLRYSTLLCLLAFASDAVRGDLATQLHEIGERIPTNLHFEQTELQRGVAQGE
jgi:AcrR family transcriptional regulator